MRRCGGHADDATEFPELRAHAVPEGYARFDDGMRGLIEAPLVLAEHALGLRPPPTAVERAAILRYAHFDPALLQDALPTALAWRHERGVKP